LFVISLIAITVLTILYAEVLRENVWLFRTVEVQENQKVIDTLCLGRMGSSCIHTELFLMVDSRAKNMFPPFIGAGIVEQKKPSERLEMIRKDLNACRF